jgi:hypothetical protein
LTKAIQNGGVADQKIIGFYRTHLEQRINLRPEDLECMRSKFNDPGNVFLIIRPREGRASAGFFFWQDGSVVGGLTFPFSSAELNNPSWSTLVGGSRRVSSLNTMFLGTRDSFRGISRGMKLGLLAMLVVLIAIAFALRLSRPASTPTSPPVSQTAAAQTPGTSPALAASQPLGLRVEKALMGVIVAWNPAAPQIAIAKDANLVIWDGSNPPAFIRLSTVQLHAGRAFFNSGSDRVEVRMDVIGPAGQARSESIISTDRPPEVLGPAQGLTASALPAVRPPVIPALSGNRIEDAPAAQPERVTRPPARLFVPAPPVAKAGTAPAELPQPPEVQSPDISALTQTFHSFNPPPAAPRPAPEATRTVMREAPAQPVPESRPQPQPPAVPAVAIRTAEAPPQPAVPIREVRPQIPPQLKPMVQSDNVVEILVHISDAGKVTAAKIGTVKGASTGFLSKLAVTAAMGWLFRPATVNGKPVQSDKILEFRFRANGR